VRIPTIPLTLPGRKLRAPRLGDAESLPLHADNRAIWRNLSDRFPLSVPAGDRASLGRAGHIAFGGDHGALAFDDVAVGGAGIVQGEGQICCNVKIGCRLGAPFPGRGITSAAARALTELAFVRPGVTRAFAGMHADNLASMRVLQNNGFEREGVMRKNVMKADCAIDRVLWAKIRP